METKKLASDFESTIEKLQKKYVELSNEYFFTEKELHSYFYHLCLESGKFIHKGYNLIHAEYPTPFKCSFKGYGEVTVENDNSMKHRAHIDLVLINPNFIDWVENNVKEQDKRLGYIKGLKNEKFSIYIKDFFAKYKNFYNDKEEPILLYALEFKYFRSTIEGNKSRKFSIRQDVNKLKELKLFGGNNFCFCKEIKTLVFIGTEADGSFREEEDIRPFSLFCDFVKHP